MGIGDWVRVVQVVFGIYMAILFVRIILSYFRTPSYLSPWLRVWNFFYGATEPLLVPIRNVLRRSMRGSAVDFSPLILWLLLYVAQMLIIRLLRSY